MCGVSPLQGQNGADLVLSMVKDSCEEHDLPEAQAWVEGSKPQCEVGEMGQIAWSDPQV